MKTSNLILAIIIFIFSLALILSLNKIKILHRENSDYINAISRTKTSFDQILNHTKQQWIYDGLVIDNIAVTDFKGEKCMLHNILKKSKAVLFIHESFCSECVNEVIEVIKTSQYVEDITIIGCFETMATLKLLTEGSYLSHCYFNTEFRRINTEFDTCFSPVFFFVNESMQTDHAFFPIKGSPSIIIDYLSVYLKKQ